MKHMQAGIVSLIILFLFSISPPLQARQLSLGDALTMAEQHSHEVKRAEAESEAAGRMVSASKGERWPTLSLNANAFYNDYVPKLSIELPGAPAIEREVGTHENYQTDTRLTLPLYTGGRITSGIRIAESEQQIRQALAKGSKDQIALGTRITWFRLSRSSEMVKAVDAAYKRVAIVNRNVQSLYDAGAADSVSILDASVALTKAQSDLDAARSQRRSDEIALAILLGLNPDEPIEISDQLAAPSADTILPDQFWMENASYQAATGQYNAARNSMRMAQADYLPTLAAYAGYSYGKPNLDRFNNSWNGNATVGASLNWSFNLGGRSLKNVESKRLLSDAAAYRQDEVAEQLTREARLARERMMLALDQYEHASRTVELSSRNYALAERMHGEGALSTNRLLEIEADLTRAEAAMTAAKSDFYITQSSWFYTIGSDKLQKGI